MTNESAQGLINIRLKLLSILNDLTPIIDTEEELFDQTCEDFKQTEKGEEIEEQLSTLNNIYHQIERHTNVITNIVHKAS